MLYALSLKKYKELTYQMKKRLIGVLTAVLLVSGGAVVASADSSASNKTWPSFEEMKSHMQVMHPNLSEEQLQEMYNNCPRNHEGMQVNGKGYGMGQQYRFHGQTGQNN